MWHMSWCMKRQERVMSDVAKVYDVMLEVIRESQPELSSMIEELDRRYDENEQMSFKGRVLGFIELNGEEGITDIHKEDE